MVAYGSLTLSKSERNYCVTRRELLALVYFMHHFRSYLLDCPFLVRIDHAPLRSSTLRNQKDKSPDGLSYFKNLISESSTGEENSTTMLMPLPCSQCGLDHPSPETSVCVAAQVTPQSGPQNSPVHWNPEETANPPTSPGS